MFLGALFYYYFFKVKKHSRDLRQEDCKFKSSLGYPGTAKSCNHHHHHYQKEQVKWIEYYISLKPMYPKPYDFSMQSTWQLRRHFTFSFSSYWLGIWGAFCISCVFPFELAMFQVPWSLIWLLCWAVQVWVIHYQDLFIGNERNRIQIFFHKKITLASSMNGSGHTNTVARTLCLSRLWLLLYGPLECRKMAPSNAKATWPSVQSPVAKRSLIAHGVGS